MPDTRFLKSAMLLIVAVCIFLVSCNKEDKVPQPSASGFIPVENLKSKMDKSYEMASPSLWIPTRVKESGPYTYYGRVKFSGKAVKRYKDKTIMYTGEYCGGLVCGLWIYYYENGAKKSEVTRSVNSPCEQSRKDYALDGSLIKFVDRAGCDILTEEEYPPGTKW